MTDDSRKDVSDGYHTFGELYAHRRALMLVLMRAFPNDSFRTRLHHPDDATPMFPDCFLIGIDSPAGPIRYHVGVEHWSLFDGILTLPHAPLWDGAGPAETVERLHAWHPERWDCDAYGPEGTRNGALCFFSPELGQRDCRSHAMCSARMTLERQRVHSIPGPIGDFMRAEFPDPEMMLNATRDDVPEPDPRNAENFANALARMAEDPDPEPAGSEDRLPAIGFAPLWSGVFPTPEHFTDWNNREDVVDIGAICDPAGWRVPPGDDSSPVLELRWPQVTAIKPGAYGHVLDRRTGMISPVIADATRRAAMPAAPVVQHLRATGSPWPGRPAGWQPPTAVESDGDDEEPDRDGADQLETEPYRNDFGDPLG